MTMAAVLLNKSLKMFCAKLVLGHGLAAAPMSETERCFCIDDNGLGASGLGLLNHVLRSSRSVAPFSIPQRDQRDGGCSFGQGVVQHP